jgi:hypothetical protein
LNVILITLMLIFLSLSSIIKKEYYKKIINIEDLIKSSQIRICYEFYQENINYSECTERDQSKLKKNSLNTNDFDFIFDHIKSRNPKEILNFDLHIFGSVILLDNEKTSIHTLYNDLEKLNKFLKKIITISLNISSILFYRINVSFSDSVLK